MRSVYLIAYDIADPKRLRRTYRCMRGYGDPVQLSVFRCDLSRQERIHLEADLLKIIHRDEDQILFCKVGPAKPTTERRLTTLGRTLPSSERHAVVI